MRIVSGIIHAYEVCNNLYVKWVCEKRIKFFPKQTYGTLQLRQKKRKKRNWCAYIIGCDINRFVLVECGTRIDREKNVMPSACKYII